MNRMQAAEQFRRALQLFAESLSDEAAMVIPTVYETWNSGSSYQAGALLTYGNNPVGDPQLYRVLQAHTAQEDWTPDSTPSLYASIGLTADGIPLWAQPAGAHDAYAEGDIVSFEGSLYRSLIDTNVYSPAVCPEYWEAIKGGAE